jgi:acyl carrier protein
MIPSPQLKQDIKKLIIDALKLSDVKPEDIADGALLFENNPVLQIDSVDALEIIVALQRTYSVHIDDRNLSRFIIRSVDSIAEFIGGELEKRESGKP